MTRLKKGLMAALIVGAGIFISACPRSSTPSSPHNGGTHNSTTSGGGPAF